MTNAQPVSDDEKVQLRDFLMRLFAPMEDNITVALYTGHLQYLQPQALAELSKFWNESLEILKLRAFSEPRYRQAAASLLSDIELNCAEKWIRDRFNSWLPLAAMTGFTRSQVDIESKVLTFLNQMREIDVDSSESPALLALDALTSRDETFQAVQIGVRAVTVTPEHWYGDYATGPLALPLLGIVYCNEQRKVIPERYHWAYIMTDQGGGTIAMRWAFYHLLEPSQTTPMLRKITYSSARDNDEIIPDGGPHWDAIPEED